MSQTKFILAGFTLIEALIAISMLGIAGLVASSLLLTSLTSSSKVEVSKEVRQNGDYALSVMEGLILSSQSVDCRDEGGSPSNKQIWVTDIEGNTAKFLCDDEMTNKISSSSPAFVFPVDLTGSNVFVSGCNFTCEQATGLPTKVDLEFTVSQKGSGSSQRPNEKSSHQFKSEVLLKNY